MRFALLCVVVLPLVGWGYPIPPQSLWSLTKEATVIVDAFVDDVKDLEVETDQWSDSVAVLHVEKAWKGRPPREVHITYSRRIVCPAPPHYEKGRRVIAFLEQDEKGAWHTVALSYGTRYPADETERNELEAAVSTALVLQREGRAGAEAEWAMMAFANPATRWDALFLLQRDTDELQAFYARLPSQAPLPSETLAKLEDAFVARPSFDHVTVQVMALFADRPSKRLDAVFVDVLETVFVAERAPWWADDALTALERRLSVAKVSPPPARDDLEREFLAATARRARGEEEAVQARWEQVKKRYKLRPKQRDDYRRHVWTPTGGETPF